MSLEKTIRNMMAPKHIVEAVDPEDKGEYDNEGEMAKTQLQTMIDAAEQLRGMLKDDENMPEWVQSKITKAVDYIDSARDYMKSKGDDGKAPVGEEVEFRDEELNEKFGRLDKKDANYFGWVVRYEIRSKGYTRAFDLKGIGPRQETKAEKELPRLLKIIAKENRVKPEEIENAKIEKQQPAGFSLESIEEEKSVRQLLDPKKEVMVVKMMGKRHKVIVIDKSKEKEYLSKGWMLAEENLIEKEMGCPLATQDVKINTKNRDATIKNFMYGPLNVDEPGDYWEKVADKWDTTVEAAKKSKCSNCVAFDISERMKDCMPGETSDDDGELGYCWMHHFKCHSARTCTTWAKGGPITDDDKSYDWQERKEAVSPAQQAAIAISKKERGEKGQVKEGTWHVPMNSKQKEQLKNMMKKPIKLGKDGQDATAAISDLIGDDDLYDDLFAAGQKNPRGDARDVVKKHAKRLRLQLEELNIEEIVESVMEKDKEILAELNDNVLSLDDTVRSVVFEKKLDKVNPKAVKKDFDDRKDKDIDNDGDVDDSDEYLHKRRQAVSKAVKNERVIDAKKMDAYRKFAKDNKVDDDSVRMAYDNPNDAETKRMMKNKTFVKAVQMYKSAKKESVEENGDKEYNSDTDDNGVLKKKKKKDGEGNTSGEPIDTSPTMDESEEKMTDAQMKKREEIVKELKKKTKYFEDKYGERAKEVMYATATKMAMKTNK